jgi:hypothetical protein
MARKIQHRNFKKTVAIVGDGFTEKIYFDQLKEMESLDNIIIKPELPRKAHKGGAYKRTIETAKSLLEKGYDYVYCLIDFDTVISEKNIAAFKKDIACLDQNYFTVYVNNPCFETWILLHFEKTAKLFSSCEEVSTKILPHTKDYNKRQDYFKRKNIYRLLKPYLAKAIQHAASLEVNRSDHSDKQPRAEIFKIFKTLNIPLHNEPLKK